MGDLNCHVRNYIRSSIRRVFDEPNDRLDSLLPERRVKRDHSLACLLNKPQDLSVRFRWLIHLLLEGLDQDEVRDREKLARCVTQRLKGAHEAKQGLDLTLGDLPMLAEQVERHESGNALTSSANCELGFVLQIESTCSLSLAHF